jgi:hypothetical protein
LFVGRLNRATFLHTTDARNGRTNGTTSRTNVLVIITATVPHRFRISIFGFRYSDLLARRSFKHRVVFNEVFSLSPRAFDFLHGFGIFHAAQVARLLAEIGGADGAAAAGLEPLVATPASCGSSGSRGRNPMCGTHEMRARIARFDPQLL